MKKLTLSLFCLFALCANTVFAQTDAIFTNSTPITIPAGPANGNPYPSAITVAGCSGTIPAAPGSVKVTLNNFSHTFPDDVGIVLVGPNGDALLLMNGVTSDTGGQAASNVTFTISDDGATQLPDSMALTAGTFRPAAYYAGDLFPAPGPGTAYGNPGPAGGGTATFQSVFGGDAPNGVWNLFVRDFVAGDSGTIAGGWTLDLNVTCGPAAPTNSRGDFDGDGRTDVGVFRNGNWFVQRSTAGFTSANWGASGDVIVPGDFDGDNRTDYAVWRPGVQGFFYVLNSNTFTTRGVAWGQTGDIPKVGDFNNDNQDDYCVYRPSNNRWYNLSTTGSVSQLSFGPSGGTPIVMYWDANAVADHVVVTSGGGWYIRRSGTGTVQFIQWGQAGDRFIAADFDNDNREDTAVFRNGIWYVLTATFTVGPHIYFGSAGDRPVPGDYDGDGDDDAAVFRNGTWFIRTQAGGVSGHPFGLASDVPIPSHWSP